MTQRPDATTAKDSGGGFTPHSEGQHGVVCVDVINLGTKLETFPGAEPREVDKVALVFASGERQEAGQLVLLTVEMTLSMNEKANLRKFLESWRGRSYTAEQAEKGVPLEKLQGNTALVSVEHITTKTGRRFAKVQSVAPLPQAMAMSTDKVAALLEEYERPQFFADRKEEYAAGVLKHRAAYMNTVDAIDDEYDDEDMDDGEELPF